MSEKRTKTGRDSGFADSYRPGFMEILAPEETTPAAVAPDLSVGVIALQNFTLLALAGFVDALRLAGDVGDRSRPLRCRWTLFGDGRFPIRSSSGIQITSTEPYGSVEGFDYIVVVGGLLKRRVPLDPDQTAYLKKAVEAGVTLIGLCNGVFALAEAGLMKGYRCCVHGYHDLDFELEFPSVETVTDQIFVVDRDRITCAGGAASIDLAGYLIGKHCGRERALKILPHLLVDEIREDKHAQLPLVDDYFAVFDDRVRRAVFIMEQNMEEPPTIDELARRVGTNVRQLERGFHKNFGVKPKTFFRTMRIKHGRWLITHSTKPITQIAHECGFNDSSHFGRYFKQAYGITPASLRRRREPSR